MKRGAIRGDRPCSEACSLPPRQLTFASTAFAQTAAAGDQARPRADFIKKLDADSPRSTPITTASGRKAELDAAQQRAALAASAALQAEFKQLDTNKDGQLSLKPSSPRAAHVELNAEQMLAAARHQPRRQISADEFRAPQLANFAETTPITTAW